MQGPINSLSKTVKDERLDFVARDSAVAGVCEGALAWALAITKTIDLCGLR